MICLAWHPEVHVPLLDGQLCLPMALGMSALYRQLGVWNLAAKAEGEIRSC